MNQAIIFDWGGIVESHENNLEEFNNAKIRLVKRFHSQLSDDEILKRWTYDTRDGVSFGTIQEEEKIKEWVTFLQERMGIKVPFSEFQKGYEEEFSKIKSYQEVVAFAHSLKGKCQLGILSNLMPLDKKRIHEQYDLSQFDYVYLSFEIGMLKPDPRVYEYVLNDLGIAPENILFIDDEEANIKMAQQYGWQTCQAVGYELDKIKEKVASFLKQ